MTGVRDLLAQTSGYAVRVVSSEPIDGGLALLLADSRGGTIRWEACVVREDVLRFRLSAGEFAAPEYDAVRPGFFAEKVLISSEEDSDGIVLRTRALCLRVTRDPFSVAVFAEKGAAGEAVCEGHDEAIYEEQFADANAVGEGQRRVPPLGYTLDEQGRIESMNFCPRLCPGERIFGLGERFGELNRRGQSVRMWNKDTLGCRDGQAYKNIPFYVSSRGYGLFLNTHRDARFHVGSLSHASLCVQAPGESAEVYLLLGAPRQVVGTFTQMTGPAACPPAWSFGLWHSNGFQGSSDQGVLEDAREFRRRGIPCDVMHLDCFWLREDRWCDFVWDEAAFPNRLEMLRSLRREHYKVCLWINPYVTCRTEMYEEGARLGYFLKNAQGQTYLADLWHGLLSQCAVLDVTHPDAVAWFQRKLRTVLGEGVDTLKTDFGEDIPEDSVFHNGRTGREMRNIYANLYNRIVYEVVGEACGAPVVWGRSGGAGMQRTPVCWSGDPRSCFEGMAATLRGGLSLGVSGVPFWSHDIGGFYGPVSDEVFVRWAQFGLLSSHSRLHGTTDRRPWSFSPRACEAVTAMIRLRYRLMPYILHTAEVCAREGLPFIRPLWMHHPDDPAVWSVQDQYYLGEDMLVAPVFGGEGAARDVYLPKGGWMHWFTGERYEGARWHRVVSPLEQLPLFVREGVHIPQNAEEAQWL